MFSLSDCRVKSVLGGLFFVSKCPRDPCRVGKVGQNVAVFFWGCPPDLLVFGGGPPASVFFWGCPRPPVFRGRGPPLLRRRGFPSPQAPLPAPAPTGGRKPRPPVPPDASRAVFGLSVMVLNFFPAVLWERMEQGGDPRAGICLRSLICVPVRISSKMLMVQMQAPAREWGDSAGIRSLDGEQALAGEDGYPA